MRRHIFLLLTFSILFIVGTITIDSVFAQSYTGSLSLDPISSKVRTGDTIVFSGKLVTTSGVAVTGATIYIKDDVAFGRDKVIGTVVTGNDGKFSATWNAVQRSRGSYDFYAIYEGNNNVGKSRSLTYTVSVSSSYSDGSTSSSSTSSSGASVKTPAAQTSIILDRIPSSINAGQTVTFTGKLTSNGKALSNAFVQIKENDPFSPDQRLAYTRTDSNGKFNTTWKVTAGLHEVDFDVYAVFDGDSLYKRSKSPDQTMSVLKYGGSIVMYSIPSSVKVGDVITFSGKLDFTEKSTEGAIVYIKDEDPFSPDDLLATAYVDRFGKFSADWHVSQVDRDKEADIYAVFEGNSILYRLTTCDSGPTKDFGGLCNDTIPLRVSGTNSPSTGNRVLTGDEFMELYYSHKFSQNPKIAIVPSPDSYNDVRSHIVPIQEGVRMWESELERTIGGNWNVSFEIVQPGSLFFNSKPDIIMNLVTRDDDSSCGTEYSGVAYVSKNKPVQTVVCSTGAGYKKSNTDVSSTAAHEFIHAMGLGHAFNKQGDMMCSIENGKPTCPNVYSKSKTPSKLNYAAVVKLYGSDGYKNPNPSIQSGSKFTANDFLNWDSTSTKTIPKQTVIDSDNDGIPDSRDKCDYERENFNNYKDTDGCPDVKPSTTTTKNTNDFDNDGIIDSRDNCASVVNKNQKDSDFDGYGDACDMDIDNDGISNSRDNCDYQKETFNNYKDTDGCPDVKPNIPSKPIFTERQKQTLTDKIDNVSVSILKLKEGMDHTWNYLVDADKKYTNSQSKQHMEKAWKVYHKLYAQRSNTMTELNAIVAEYLIYENLKNSTSKNYYNEFVEKLSVISSKITKIGSEMKYISQELEYAKKTK
ncbi:MAG: hypothetical protein HOD60_10905 [Candidatus Nitrosopelagicus sp.]|nr:hypothetical protein [Candidatus Nitrosopelagicus sp.]